MEIADKCIVVDYGYFGFNAADLLKTIYKLDAAQYLGFVYGSGFEAQPDLLQKISEIIPLIGNSQKVMRDVKTASEFFAMLTFHNILHPQIFDSLPFIGHAEVYLKKFQGGCGGTHIKIVRNDCETLEANHYYQSYIEGQSISVLFIANAQNMLIIGMNEQWLSPTSKMPFRYGGAVSQVKLPQNIYDQLSDIAEKLIKIFGLIGLNSLDAIVRDDIVYILEINPRLSATFDLYQDEEVNLLDLHIQACINGMKFQNNCVNDSLDFSKKSKAHSIVYAKSSMLIPADFEWPTWVVDIPNQDTQKNGLEIMTGDPVCTVVAQADVAEVAKNLAHTRVKIIQSLFDKYSLKGSICKT